MTLWTRRLRDRLALAIFVLLAVGAAVVVTWTMRQGYAVYRLTRGVGDTWFLDASGQRWFRMDERRRDVPLSAIPGDLQHAFIAIEDHRFYRHPGVDPVALGRAIGRNLRSPGTVEGGSTLTQQLARTLFLSNRKTYGRKLHEAVLAVMIDAQLSKDQILELYLNRIYLSAGMYGVETMSRNLFGKPAKDLSLPQSALIAGLARAPAALSPWNHLDAAVARSHTVLTRMREEGFITAGQEKEARRARLRIRPYPGPADARGGYPKEYLRQAFRDRFGGDHPPDWEVRTTFVPSLQEAAEGAVASGLRRFRNGKLQAALVSIDAGTGDILAMVGGRDFRETQFNRAVRSRRQPGSAFKPLLYAVALERGFSPVSVLSGLGHVAPQGPDEWTPRNAGRDEPDELTLRAALVESDNRAASLLQQRVGTRPVLRLASDLGLRDLPDVPSLSLGTGLVTPLDLTAAFAAFPNGGLAVRPRAMTSITDAEGAVVFEDPVRQERVVSPQVAYQMVSILRDAMERGTAAGSRSLGITFPAGGKTGTTDDFKDAWFVGFTATTVTGVWVGLDRPQTIAANGYGARYALPIWSDYMRRAARVRRPGDFVEPPGLRDEPICQVSYRRAVEGCPSYVEHFKDGDDIPTQLCTIHRGTLKQRVRRVVEGAVTGLGRRIADIFRRKK